MDKPPFPRALPFTTEKGVELWALPVLAGEVAPRGSDPRPLENDCVQMIHRDGKKAGLEDCTFSLSFVSSYAEKPTFVDAIYSQNDMIRLGHLVEAKLRQIEAPAPLGPRSRLSELATRQ
jgi:hypothetical protein